MKTRSRTNSEAEMNKMLKQVIAGESSEEDDDEGLDQSFHSSESEVKKKKSSGLIPSRRNMYVFVER